MRLSQTDLGRDDRWVREDGRVANSWVKLEIEIPSFDRSCVADELAEFDESGLIVQSLPMLGDTDANRRRLYDLNKECSADIPGRGEFHTWEQYQQRRLDVPSFDPSGVLIVVDDDEWVAMSVVSRQPGRAYAFNEMTGVRRTHRGRGLALATKVASFEAVHGWDRTTARTVHHPKNEAMIALNRKLGYTDGTWDYPLTY